MSTDGGRGQYEFNDQQNRIIADLGSGVRVVGLLLFLLGFFQAFTLIAALVRLGWDSRLAGPYLLTGAGALIYLSLGWWFNRASAGFINVAATQGRDVDNLMHGLNELRKSFSLVRTLIFVFGVFILMGLVAALIEAYSSRGVPV
jgi:hypothetical protein